MSRIIVAVSVRGMPLVAEAEEVDAPSPDPVLDGTRDRLGDARAGEEGDAGKPYDCKCAVRVERPSGARNGVCPVGEGEGNGKADEGGRAILLGEIEVGGDAIMLVGRGRAFVAGVGLTSSIEGGGDEAGDGARRGVETVCSVSGGSLRGGEGGAGCTTVAVFRAARASETACACDLVTTSSSLTSARPEWFRDQS